MNAVKSSVGKDCNKIAALAYQRQVIEDGVSIGTAPGIDASGAEVFCKFRRGKLFAWRNGVKRQVFPDHHQIGIVKGCGIILLKNGASAGIGPRLKHHHQPASGQASRRALMVSRTAVG